MYFDAYTTICLGWQMSLNFINKSFHFSVILTKKNYEFPVVHLGEAGEWALLEKLKVRKFSKDQEFQDWKGILV